MADKITAPWTRPTVRHYAEYGRFVTDYVSFFTATMGRQPTVDEYSQIMTGFTPEDSTSAQWLGKKACDVRSLVQ